MLGLELLGLEVGKLVAGLVVGPLVVGRLVSLTEGATLGLAVGGLVVGLLVQRKSSAIVRLKYINKRRVGWSKSIVRERLEAYRGRRER